MNAEPLADLLAEVEQAIRRYIVTGAAEAATCALWVAHTHTFEAADFTPYLSIVAPEKSSGKSHLLKVIGELSARPIQTTNMSDAVVFRVIEARQPTLLFDEIDAVFGPKARDREDLRGLLNAGFERGTLVWRMGGKQFAEIQDFEVFCPKAFAGIGKLPDTIRDRSIEIELKRKKADETTERFLIREVRARLAPLHDRLEKWGVAAVDALAAMEPVYLPLGDDRAMDLWEPLTRIATLAGEEWIEKARISALQLSGSRRLPDDESIGVLLLSDLRQVFDGPEEMATRDVLAALKALPEALWSSWGREGLNDRGLAKELRKFQIHSRQIRPPELDGQQVRGYKRSQFEDAWDRYLPPCDASCDGSGQAATPDGETVCDGVTAVTLSAEGNGERHLTAEERVAVKAEVDRRRREALERRADADKALFADDEVAA